MSRNKMVPRAGFEPETFPLGEKISLYSNQRVTSKNNNLMSARVCTYPPKSSILHLMFTYKWEYPLVFVFT